jgi:TRAP-type C4-dicarboxylate transport system permease small subunit
MTITTHTISAATVILSGVAGGKLASIATESLQMPEWMQLLTGPLGALGAALFALRWLVSRLDKSESKFEQRDLERDQNFQKLIEITTQNHRVIEQNSDILREVKEHLTR